ncbi:MAG: toast rack family protein [Anaerolineales bacterium]
MKLTRTLFLAAAALALASLACGITLTMPDDAIEIGDLRTDDIYISAPSGGKSAQVTLEFGAGELNLSPGSNDGLIVGTATYNVDGIEPVISAGGSDVSIKQEPYEFKIGGLPNVKEVENTWDLYFSDHPMDLEVRAGAFTGNFEFGGMAIQELQITSGASKVDVGFTTPNLTAMGQFHFRTGASTATLNSLSNANFSLMKFEGGAGSYTLDFSGALTRDATVEIDAALSNVKLIVPENIPTTLQIEGSLTNVNAHGRWSGTGSYYSLPGEGPSLTFLVKLGAGNLDLSTLP